MSKLLVFTITGLAIIVIGGYFLLFTPARLPILLKKPATSGNVLKVIGTLPKIKRVNREEIMGGKNLCWVPPECQEINKRKGEGGWSQEELDKLTPEQRNTCIFDECRPFPGSVWAGEREKILLELSDAETTELIKLYLPKEIKLKDVVLLFERAKILVNTHSYYPLAPGFVTAEAARDRYGFKLTSLYLGKIPAPESLRQMVENNISPVITDFLSEYGVAISIMEMQGSKLTVIGEAPKGLIKREGGVLVINFDTLPKATPSPAENGGDMRIQ